LVNTIAFQIYALPCNSTSVSRILYNIISCWLGKHMTLYLNSFPRLGQHNLNGWNHNKKKRIKDCIY
jgi:hypothetical protein